MTNEPSTTAGSLLDHGEPRWPATLAIIVAVVLYITLPEALTVGPTWLVPLLELALIMPLSVTAPRRRVTEKRWQAAGAIALIAIINAANVASLVLLVHVLATGSKIPGTQLLLSSAQIWLTNIIVFALWYWEIDRGGPDERSGELTRTADFLFPQMVTPECAAVTWRPTFLDYLFLAFTNATAFSPTDTMPLTHMAKSLMAVQALTSLLTIALVAARAVNILS